MDGVIQNKIRVKIVSTYIVCCLIFKYTTMTTSNIVKEKDHRERQRQGKIKLGKNYLNLIQFWATISISDNKVY